MLSHRLEVSEARDGAGAVTTTAPIKTTAMTMLKSPWVVLEGLEGGVTVAAGDCVGADCWWA